VNLKSEAKLRRNGIYISSKLDYYHALHYRIIRAKRMLLKAWATLHEHCIPPYQCGDHPNKWATRYAPNGKGPFGRRLLFEHKHGEDRAEAYSNMVDVRDQISHIYDTLVGSAIHCTEKKAVPITYRIRITKCAPCSCARIRVFVIVCHENVYEALEATCD